MRLLLFVPVAVVCACGGVQSNEARAQEAARELNESARFGRNEVVMARVAAKEREDFAHKHRLWGSDVRLTDAELGSFHMTSDDDAEVTVRVGWYRPDEQELRVTVLRQKWHSLKGDWQLVGEERIDGEIGLLGEPVVKEVPQEPRPPAHFPTIKLGTND